MTRREDGVAGRLARAGVTEREADFHAPGGDAARTAVAGAAAALAAFENAALDAETSGSAPAAGPGQPRLRAVDGP